MEILPGLIIEDESIRFSFVRAQGPGGQHVNKTATAVVLRFAVSKAGLPLPMLERFQLLALNHLNKQGEVIIKAERYRSQLQNREDALDRLRSLLKRALHAPKKRKKTKPTFASVERRLLAKKRKSTVKSARHKHIHD